MRQLKGKAKESARERRERKQDFLTNKEKLFSVALPVFAAFWLVVILFIYFAVQPKILSDSDL
jgi:cell division protein FtsL